jgi:DNA end-binding protein Ku
MPRAIWKGAIAFGLVHVPVALYPAVRASGVDFDWLDARTMDRVGYKRVNKRTGREVAPEHVVRGVRSAEGEYAVLDDDEIRAAYPRTTQTISLESFASAAEIPFVYLDRPFYLEPHSRGERVYALLRDSLASSGKVGIARVVIQTREHLAALVPDGPLLVLETLRWGREIRDASELRLPPAGKSANGPKEAELKMARALIDEMTEPWDPRRHEDHFEAAIMKLVDRKIERGDTERVEPLETGTIAPRASNVVDLTELLKRSLANGARPADREPAPGKRERGRRRA